MTAVNSKYQSTVNKAVAWLEKYNTNNDLREHADNIGDERMYKKYDRLCEKQFDKFLEYMDELPKREQKQIYKSELY